MDIRKCVREGYGRELLATACSMWDEEGLASFESVLGKELYRKVHWLMMLYGCRDVKLYNLEPNGSVYSIFETETLELIVSITSVKHNQKQFSLWKKHYFEKKS